ncbi:MAG: hypothetical protein ACYTF6_09875 [Planctomycetota bacterium]|jgi:hypothetical protein
MTQGNQYKRADFDILSKTGYGVGVHWTYRTLPRKGPKKPFAEAVEAFDVPRFVEQVRRTGAGHLLFTSNHVYHYIPGPNPEVDKILPGRTCRRDLIMEIADALEAAGIKLILYYNHGICGDNDEWIEAVGGRDEDKSRYFDNLKRIIGWMGEHYGDKVIAWWFDGAKIFKQWAGDFAEITAAAKAGLPQRLVCYNNALECVASLTEHQDYWAGETARANFVPRGPTTPAGLPWYGFFDWHAHHDHMWVGCWGFWEKQWLDLDWPAPSTETLAEFYRRFEALGGTVTYNLLIYQEGQIYPGDLEAMGKVKRILRRT